MNLKQALVLPLALAACQLPGTRPLTEAEDAYVAGVIGEEQDRLSAIIPILGYTDTLFDLKGESIESNEILAENLQSNLDQLWDYYDRDKIVVGFDDFFEGVDPGEENGEEIGASAYGGRWAPWGQLDDFIVLPEDPSETVSSGWKLRPIMVGFLPHEVNHLEDTVHSEEVKEAKSQKEQEAAVMDNHDPAYLTEYLYQAGERMRGGYGGEFDGILGEIHYK